MEKGATGAVAGRGWRGEDNRIKLLLIQRPNWYCVYERGETSTQFLLPHEFLFMKQEK